MVLQVAASGNVKECYGIEKAEIPAKYAEVSIFHSFFSGYVGSKSFLEEVLQVVHQLRKANPNLVFGMYKAILFFS